MQRILNDQNDPGTACRQHRYVTRELNRVPKSLVRVDEDGLSFNVLVSEPHGLRTIPTQRRFRNPPTCLAPLPTGFEITKSQTIEGSGPFCLRVGGIQ